MIHETIRMIESALGTSLPADTRQNVAAGLCREFGGTHVYVPKLPKLQARVALGGLGTASGMSVSAQAGALGKSARQVRRIVRGR